MSQRILKCTVCGGDHSIFHCENKCGFCHGDNRECSCSEQPPPDKKKEDGKAEIVLWLPTEGQRSLQAVRQLPERAQVSRDGVPKPERAGRRTRAGLSRTGSCFRRADQPREHKGQGNQEHGEKTSEKKKSWRSESRGPVTL